MSWFFDEIGQLCAKYFATFEIIFCEGRESETFMGGVVIISTMEDIQLQPVLGRTFLLPFHLITCYQIMKIETSVQAFGAMLFQRSQQIIQMHYSSFTNDILDELQNLLIEVPTYVST